MTTDRTWVHNRMVNSTVGTFIGGRIFQSTSIHTTPHDKPFILYRQTSDVADVRGDDHDRSRTVGYQIFVHDIPGSYRRIDLIMTALHAMFADVNDPAALVIRSTWVDRSDDQRDEDMGTIMKFARISVKYRA